MTTPTPTEPTAKPAERVIEGYERRFAGQADQIVGLVTENPDPQLAENIIDKYLIDAEGEATFGNLVSKSGRVYTHAELLNNLVHFADALKVGVESADQAAINEAFLDVTSAAGLRIGIAELFNNERTAPHLLSALERLRERHDIYRQRMEIKAGHEAASDIITLPDRMRKDQTTPVQEQSPQDVGDVTQVDETTQPRVNVLHEATPNVEAQVTPAESAPKTPKEELVEVRKQVYALPIEIQRAMGDYSSALFFADQQAEWNGHTRDEEIARERAANILSTRIPSSLRELTVRYHNLQYPKKEEGR